MVNNNRRLIRTDLAALISAATVGDGKPVAAVYTYRTATLPVSPAIVITSGGTSLKDLTFQGTIPTHRILVYIFVLYNDPTAGITEEYSEDSLDNILELVYGVISDNKVVASRWDSLVAIGSSQSDSVQIGGKEYRREVITLEAG